jgi:hypothetical protein
MIGMGAYRNTAYPPRSHSMIGMGAYRNTAFSIKNEENQKGEHA